MINLEKVQTPQRKLSHLAKKNQSMKKSNFHQLKLSDSRLFTVVQKTRPYNPNLDGPQVKNPHVVDRYKDRSNHDSKRVALNNSLNFAAFNILQKDHETEKYRKKSPKILKRDSEKFGNKSLPILKHQSQYKYQQSRLQFLKAALSGYQNVPDTQKSKSKQMNKNTIKIIAHQKTSFITQMFPKQILTSRRQHEKMQRKVPQTLRESSKLVFSQEIKQIVKQSLNDIDIERLLKKRQEGNRSLFSFRQKEAFIQKMKKILQTQKS